MKIGFDISQTGENKAGCGFFAHNLIKHIAEIDHANHYLLYRTFGDGFWDNNFQNTIAIKKSNFEDGFYPETHLEAKQFWNQALTENLVKLGDPNILHINNYFCPFEKNTHSKLVYTLYDLSVLVHPEWTTEANRLLCFEGILNASMNADHLIAISKYTKQHFSEVFPHYPKEKIEVIYPASRFKINDNLSQPSSLADLTTNDFILSVGTIEPRKNYYRLIDAYAELCAHSSSVLPFVIAGGRGWMVENFQDYLVKKGISDRVKLLGYVNEEELQWLYQNCYCFVYPSLFEGFGMPVLEAMSLGAPVITSNVSSLPEIVGQAGLMVEPHDTKSIHQQMSKLLLDKQLATALKQEGMHQAEKFSWKTAAQKTVDVYTMLNNN